MEHWYSFIYLFGIGGLIFCIPIYLGLKKGVLKPHRFNDRGILVRVFTAYIAYFVVQGLWNIWAIGSNS